MNDAQVYDFIAIGLGPFNLGLACLSAPLKDVNCLFLEKKHEFSWHAGMLLDGTTLQNPFLADMVSMADPSNPLSYLNYCKQQGRLYTYYIRENWYLSRTEFDRYCKWAASQLESVRFQHEVQEIWHDPQLSGYVVSGVFGPDKIAFQLRTRKLVIGIGGVPYLPACVAQDDTTGVVHTSSYLNNKARLQKCKNITVIGSGQSGAEVYHELLTESSQHGYTVNWVTRAARFFQMEDAKLTLELITPDYGDYFYSLDPEVKKYSLKNQRSIYNGINQSLLKDIYQTLDERSHHHLPRTQLLTNLALSQCKPVDGGGNWELVFDHVQLGRRYRHVTDGLVFATGYRHQLPRFIDGIRERIRWDDQGRYAPSSDWAVDHENTEIFVQNVGLHSHGLTGPDLGLACYRNSRLLHKLTGIDFYPCEQRTAFQDFVPRANSGFEALETRGAI
ncbi:lysine N(6)-hydroxylase/L-ornithine N(5)-oxygenase family protein [Pseudomonas sp. NPDC078700]|uniref:lysine N(6)-hydroxylase/L-ornithine N(5)-oxygenase family protein n=1 Tax=Pseudomonas sp. NPDC078700 TaxID=3364424 RepID=UPI0037C6D27B